jgi:hypothetical protein
LRFDGRKPIVISNNDLEMKLFFDNKKKILECFQALAEEFKSLPPVESFSFTISEEAWRWCNKLHGNTYKHANGVSIDCSRSVSPGFGNGHTDRVYLNRSGKWNIGGSEASEFASSRKAMLKKERILEVIAYLERQVIKPLDIPKKMFDPTHEISVENEGVTLRIGYTLTPGYDSSSKSLQLDRHGEWNFGNLPWFSDLLKDELPKFEKLVQKWKESPSTSDQPEILLQI